MPSASDIITYIGVPLAVIGVMPVMYTCTSAIITKYKVLKAVKANNVEVTTRIGLLSGVLEVDFPRFTIHPLPRDDELYWKHTDGPSHLKGGSWTLLQWQTVNTGKATYRIQHSDELRQPQAEIQLTDLFTFLLDRGATPFAHGLQLLRLMGLQTPPGTRLLVCGSRPVLTVATPDESDGHLSLKLHWCDDMRVRSSECLPPYWVRVHSRKTHGDEARYPPTRLYLGVNGLETGLIEETGDEEKMTDVPDGTAIEHLRPDDRFPGTVSMWFASATVAICGQDSRQTAGLFRFSIPPRIVMFAKRDTIPYGVLVLLGMKEEEETPLSAERAKLRKETANQRRHQALAEQHQQMQKLFTMAPAERARAQAEQGQAALRRMADERREREEEALERRVEALNSPRVSNRVVAEAAFGWLKAQGHVRDSKTLELTMQYLANSILHSMVFEPAFASEIAGMLDAWMGWMDTIMNDAHCDVLRKDQVTFCYAAVLVHQIAEYEVKAKVHPVAKDLDECQRVWRTVCLG